MNCTICYRIIGKSQPMVETNNPVKKIKMAGYACKKCAQKLLVADRTKGVGWRKALREMTSKVEKY